MGDERDQEVQRAPLWPPDPEPGAEAPQMPQAQQPDTTRATPPPWDQWSAPAEPAPTPQDVSAPTAPSIAPQSPWQPTGAPVWSAPPEAPSIAEAQTVRISAAPAPAAPVAPTEPPPPPPIQAGAPFSPAPRLEAADAPTQRYTAAPLATEAPSAAAALVSEPTTAPPPPVTPAPAAPTPATPTPAAPAAPTPPSAPPAKERTGLSLAWRLGLTLFVSLLLLAGAGGLYKYAETLAAAPQHVIADYCAALKRDDYHAAYALLSSSAQGQTTEAQYLADATARDTIEGRVTQCTAKATQNLSPLSFLRSPRSLLFNATITRTSAASGQIALSRDAVGWHVAALSSTLQGIDLGPLYTEQALCKAFSQRAYNQAFTLLSTPYQKEQGNAATFARAFGDTLTITNCATDLKTYSVNSADQQGALDVTLTFSIAGVTGGNAPSAYTLPTKMTFVREATGWRVDAITPQLKQ